MATAPAGRSAPPADTRRNELLGLAAEVFARKGYARASLRDVADAAGILAGSLYHHFASKEAIAAELLSAFHEEIDEVAREERPSSTNVLDDLAAFADRMGRVAQRHRAAINLAAYDAAAGAGDELSALVHKDVEAVDGRWLALLDAGRAAGLLRVDLDVVELADVLAHATFDLAGDSGNVRLREVAVCFTEVMLHGVTTRPVADEELDGSAALEAARGAVASWDADEAHEPSARRQEILAVARAEFARRGYAATTMRDIAKASGTRASSLYRHFASKQELLDAILGRFSRHLTAGYEAIESAPGSAAQRLDALFALMTSAVGGFDAEVLIQKEWWWTLDLPPSESRPPDNAARLRLLERLIDDGVRSGEFAPVADQALLSVALRAAMWIDLGAGEGASARRHALLRSCVLGGAAARRDP